MALGGLEAFPGSTRHAAPDSRDLTGVGAGGELMGVLSGDLDALAAELLEREDVQRGRGDDDLGRLDVDVRVVELVDQLGEGGEVAVHCAHEGGGSACCCASRRAQGGAPSLLKLPPTKRVRVMVAGGMVYTRGCSGFRAARGLVGIDDGGGREASRQDGVQIRVRSARDLIRKVLVRVLTHGSMDRARRERSASFVERPPAGVIRNQR